MIRVNQLSIKYPDGTHAIKDLSFSVSDGECIALIGSNGAGKSTLLLSLVGMLSPAAGSIAINGIPLQKSTLADVRKEAGLVFQNPDDQLFMPTIYEDILFGPINYGVSKEAAERRAEEVIEELKIEKIRHKMPHKLSGGEKRLAAIASVLSMQPSVMLLDEPSSFLDPKARRTLIGVLSHLPQTKLIATHDLDLALDLCTRVILLKNGELYAEGTTAEVLTNGILLEQAGLELPLRYQTERRSVE